MTKKTFATLALSFLLACSAAAKVGVGVQCDLYLRSELPASSDMVFKDGLSSYIGDSITFASNHSPWIFALQVKGNPWYVGFTADNWFVYKSISPSAAYYLFWGPSGGAEVEKNFGVNMGARLGAGINAFLASRHLELYAQVAWNPYFGINLKHDDADLFFVKPLNFPVNAGVRVWF